MKIMVNYLHDNDTYSHLQRDSFCLNHICYYISKFTQSLAVIGNGRNKLKFEGWTDSGTMSCDYYILCIPVKVKKTSSEHSLKL